MLDHFFNGFGYFLLCSSFLAFKQSNNFSKIQRKQLLGHLFQGLLALKQSSSLNNNEIPYQRLSAVAGLGVEPCIHMCRHQALTTVLVTIIMPATDMPTKGSKAAHKEHVFTPGTQCR